MEEDELFDPIHFDVPHGTISKQQVASIPLLISGEAFDAYVALKNKGFPVSDRLFENVSKLLLTLKNNARL